MKKRENLLKEFFRPTVWKIVLTILIIVIFWFMYYYCVGPAHFQLPDENGNFRKLSYECPRFVEATNSLIEVLPLPFLSFIILTYILFCLVVYLINKIRGKTKNVRE